MLLAGGATCRASRIAYEPFDYPVGPIVGDNGGIGFSGSWSSQPGFNVTSGTLSSPADQGAGNAAELIGFASISRNLSTSFGADGTDIWLSYLTDPISVGYFSALDLNLENGWFPTVGILGGPDGVGPASAYWGMDQGSNSAGGSPQGYSETLTSVPIVLGQTTLLAVHLTSSGGTWELALYVNPGSSEPGTPDATMTVADGGSFRSLQFWGNGGDVIYDELRIGTTYADVVPGPEPSSLSFLALSVVGLVVHRRENRRRGKTA